MQFVDDMEFDRLGVFAYSPEEDTPAFSFENPGSGGGKNMIAAMRSWNSSRRSLLRSLRQ